MALGTLSTLLNISCTSILHVNRETKVPNARCLVGLEVHDG